MVRTESLAATAAVLVAVVVVLAAVDTSLAPVGAANGATYDGDRWAVTIKTDHQLSRPDTTGFDDLTVRLDADGTSSSTFVLATETSSSVFTDRDLVAVYSLSTTVLTTVTITCEGGTPVFDGDAGSGSANTVVDYVFEDMYGAQAWPFRTWGEGYTRVAVLQAVDGDFAMTPPARKAFQDRSVGDIPSQFSAGATADGVTGTYAPRDSAGPDQIPMTYSADVVTAPNTDTFEGRFQMYTQLTLQGDDAGWGSTWHEVDGLEAHRGRITGGECTKENSETVSDLELTLRNGKANLVIRERAGGEVIRTVEKHFVSPTATTRLGFDSTPDSEEGWNRGAVEWEMRDGLVALDAASPGSGHDADPDASGRPAGGPDLDRDARGAVGAADAHATAPEVGVARSDWARYSVDDGLSVELPTALGFEVIDLDESAGRVQFLTEGGGPNGTEHNLAWDTLGDREGLDAFVAPANLSVNDTVYGIGTVTGLGTRSVGTEVREVVFVTYEPDPLAWGATAVYDRETGILLSYDGNAADGDVAVTLTNSSIGSPNSAGDGHGPLFGDPIPGAGASAPPTDPDGDGVYEDVDGDGDVDFDDAVALAFADTSGLRASQQAALDVDGDGDVDFDDAVALAFQL